jgi:hypothetical protein
MNIQPDNSRRLLPHEWCFGAFLVLTWVRLVWAAGFFDGHAVAWLILIVANVRVIERCWRDATSLNWRVRLVFYPVAMNVTYFLMRDAVPKIHPACADGVLQRAENWLFGSAVSLQLQAITTPLLTEALSFCYFCFFPFLTISILFYCFRELPVLKKFCTGLFTIYGLGFIGYTLLPAKAPWRAMTEQFSVPLTGWWMTRLNDVVVTNGSNGVDAFPSLHCAVSSFLLMFDWWHRRWRFWVYLVPCVGLWIATVYLRYHYAVDCVAGFALAALALWLARPTAATPRVTTLPTPCATPSVSPT